MLEFSDRLGQRLDQRLAAWAGEDGGRNSHIMRIIRRPPSEMRRMGGRPVRLGAGASRENVGSKPPPQNTN
jgi:hypothetical protein